MAAISVDAFFRAVQAILRLSLLHPLNPQLPGLVLSSLRHLDTIEQSLPDGDIVIPKTPPSYPPHIDQDLFRASNDDSAIWWYGQCVETMWRVAMVLPKPSESWNDLTDRLLVWRAYAGAENTALGEWVRKEVVRNLVS